MIKLIDAYTPTTMPAGWLDMALIHKATQGTSNQQAAYPVRMAQHRAHGKAARGAYHAFMGNVDAAAQARYFVAYANPAATDILALDLEQFSGSWAGKSMATIASMAKTFLATVRSLCPRNRLIVYCNRSDYNAIVKAYGVPLYDGLWLATLDNTRPSSYPWLICQYAVIGGVDWNDAKFDTQAAMAAWAARGHVTDAKIEGDSTMGATTLPTGKPLFVVIGTDGRAYCTTAPGAGYKAVGPNTWATGCDVAAWGPTGAVFLLRDEDKQLYGIAVQDVDADLSKATPFLLPHRNADGTVNTKVKATSAGGVSIAAVGERFDCLIIGTDAKRTLYAASFTVNPNGGLQSSTDWVATKGQGA